MPNKRAPESDADRRAVQRAMSRGLGEQNQDAELFSEEFPEGAYEAAQPDAEGNGGALQSVVESEEPPAAGNRLRARLGAFRKASDAKREFEPGGGRDSG